jgi:CBS domain-containing protein
MAGELIYAFRVMRLPLLDAAGASLGRIDDIVIIPGSADSAARVLGFVATSQRRKIFVNANRLAVLDSDGAQLRSWDVDLNPFKPRLGEVLVGRDLIDKRIGDETVSDVALRACTDGRQTWWEPAKVRLARRSTIRRRQSYRLVDVEDVPTLFGDIPGSELSAQVAALRDMHASDVAHVVRALPLVRRKQIAEAMDDERLADLLEELPEAEQLRIIEGLDIDRLIGVLEEMEYDDLVDLLAEMPGEQRSRVIAAMDEEDAEVVRRLLAYDEGTAGALMTPDIIILGATDTVADALAQLRDPDWLVSIAAQVYVVRPPFKPPTGQYLGVVHFQRLLREPPSMELSRCLEHEPTVGPDLPEREVAERLASYNLLTLGVTDESGALLGAITVDDVLDRVLPTGWRQRRTVHPSEAG